MSLRPSALTGAPIFHIAAVCLLLLGASLTGPAPVLAQTLVAASNSQMVRNFDEIALRNEHQRLRNPRITKWMQPLRVYIRADVAPGQYARRDLRAQFKRLQRLTGLPVRFVPNRAAANFYVIFTNLDRFARTIRATLRPARPRLARKLARADCVGVFSRNLRSSEIVAATVIIPVDHAFQRGIMHRCIVEETTQVMGLPNDSARIDITLFNDRARRDDLTRHDELLLRVLYHPAMRPGLNRAAALAVARRIMPTVRRKYGY